MAQRVRARFWIELVSTLTTGCLAVITLAWHDWIEVVFGTDPDHGNGSLEWFIFAAFAVATAAFAVAVSLEWRRARVAEV